MQRHGPLVHIDGRRVLGMLDDVIVNRKISRAGRAMQN